MSHKNRNIILISLVVFSFFLMSWGYNGHRIINGNTHLSFNPEMAQFQAWALTLAEHASDADYRKDTDPNEGPRHYIDIDNYPGFLANGRIPQSYDSVVALYGPAFVIDQGVLPWATKIAYDSLVNSFIRFDWNKAVLFAADIGHYVGDAHNPLHITRNYNGQYTNNYGIHSRYETGMVNAFKEEIIVNPAAISFIADVDDYIFNYIYSNYIYVDSIMIADTYAQGVAGNSTSYEYKEALWEKTRSFTIPLFNNASHALAELIYSAWVEAGKPDMNSGPGIFEFGDRNNALALKIVPNPVITSSVVSFEMPDDSDVTLKLYDFDGNQVETLLKTKIPAGSHELSFNLGHLPDGLYFIVIENGKTVNCRKFVKAGF